MAASGLITVVPSRNKRWRGTGRVFFASRAQWLAGAPAFNADKGRTLLLMEYTKGGIAEEPLSAYEFHTALVDLKKPVDLSFYPLGNHPLDTPFERGASLQRNVDWFRFWMQGYETASPPCDPDQCKRWEHLRDLRDVDARSSIATDEDVTP